MLIWHLPQIRRPLPTAQAVAYTLIQRTPPALAKMLIANIVNYAYYIVNLLFLFIVHGLLLIRRFWQWHPVSDVAAAN